MVVNSKSDSVQHVGSDSQPLLSSWRLWLCRYLPLFSVPLVSGFSTASYLKVHIKTHHGSLLSPTATMYPFPEPRGDLQMHSGAPYFMGHQCSVEGKQPPVPSQTVMLLAVICSAAFGETCCHISGYVTTNWFTAAALQVKEQQRSNGQFLFISLLCCCCCFAA